MPSFAAMHERVTGSELNSKLLLASESRDNAPAVSTPSVGLDGGVGFYRDPMQIVDVDRGTKPAQLVEANDEAP